MNWNHSNNPISNFKSQTLMPEHKKSIIKRIAGYFLRGVAVLLPVSLTFYLIVGSIDWVDRVIFNVFPPLEFPGLGFIIVVAFITIIGILFSGFIGKTVLGWLDELMT